MICTKCGARLLDTDQFCSKCGTKVIKEKRCPDCGAVLREGTKFCHKCGRLVESTGNVHQVPEETMDIPIEAIERNILSETEAKIRAERNVQDTAHRKPAARAAEPRRTTDDRMDRTAGSKNRNRSAQSEPAKRSPEPPKKKKAVPDTPPKKKKPVYREEDWEDDDWDDEDDVEESVDVITVMTAVVGCVLLVVVVFLAYKMYQQYVPKNYEKVQAEQEAEQQEEENQNSGQGVDQSGGDSESAVYTLTVVDDVNVRDNPSTSGTNILKVAKEGETYACYGSAGDGSWYEIKLEDGTKGYVYQDYVTVE